MSSISTQPPGGMRDFLPSTLVRRRYVTDLIQDVYERHGFVPLETPSIENLSTLLGKYGEEGDQLLYRILHRRDALQRALDKDGIAEADLADLGLRYDLTVPLARVVAQYSELPRYFKRYQIQPVWRADRPARGRFREFWQCDVDITGTESLLAEAEVCCAIAAVMEKLGFENIALEINHRQLLRQMIHAAGIAPGLEETALVAIDKLDKIGADGVLQELGKRGVDAASSEKLLRWTARDENASNEAAMDSLRGEVATENSGRALDDIAEVLAACKDTPAGSRLRFNPALARGLGYYTGCIFEITSPDLSGSLGGGGRYDGLVGMFGKQQIPAVGFSIGLERILLVMEERGMFPEHLRAGADAMLCWFGVPQSAVLQTANRLRSQGVKVETFPEPKKLGKQLQYTDSDAVKIPVAAILGESEWEARQLTLKNLASGEQVSVPLDRAGETIESWLGKPGA